MDYLENKRLADLKYLYTRLTVRKDLTVPQSTVPSFATRSFTVSLCIPAQVNVFYSLFYKPSDSYPEILEVGCPTTRGQQQLVQRKLSTILPREPHKRLYPTSLQLRLSWHAPEVVLHQDVNETHHSMAKKDDIQ